MTANTTKNRSDWTRSLGDAAWWIEKARESAKRGDYKGSRTDALMACAIMDEACQIETEPSE